MPMTERIVFQPYAWGKTKRGTALLEARAPILCKSLDEARRRADKVARGDTSMAGAHVVRMEVDEEAGDYGEAEIIQIAGDVPSLGD
ncbi:hypothetical protein CT154_07130 [Komagataeibacter xylinus]|nr:hypothetical protein CT154_07130 [Komagataeibacter xylinus]